MKKMIILLAAILSMSSFAGIVKTKLKGKMRFSTLSGKVRKLMPVRVFITHDTEAGLLNLSAVKNCEIEIGKKDLASLYTETDRYNCFSTGKSILISNEAVEDIFMRSAIFSFKDIFQTIDNIFNEGLVENLTVTRDANMRAITNLVLGASNVQAISLTGQTVLKIENANGTESLSLELTPIANEYL